MELTSQLVDDLGLWARRSLAPAALTEIDVWDAFERRDRVARTLVAGAALSEHLAAVLASADDAWHAARALVAPLLSLGAYLSSRPDDHYARRYLEEM